MLALAREWDESDDESGDPLLGAAGAGTAAGVRLGGVAPRAGRGAGADPAALDDAVGGLVHAFDPADLLDPQARTHASEADALLDEALSRIVAGPPAAGDKDVEVEQRIAHRSLGRYLGTQEQRRVRQDDSIRIADRGTGAAHGAEGDHDDDDDAPVPTSQKEIARAKAIQRMRAKEEGKRPNVGGQLARIALAKGLDVPKTTKVKVRSRFQRTTSK
jgi:hypothetical protein